MKKAAAILGFVVIFAAYKLTQYDLLNSMNENLVLNGATIELAIFAFCLSSSTYDGKIDIDNGHVEEDDYQKQSIYSVLYSLYDFIGTVESDKGVDYHFTFNTWGIASNPPLYEESDPERFGKTAYKSLVLFDDIKDLISEKISKNEALLILEVGCGTGAGANLISSELAQENPSLNIQYTALDMQLAAINLCNKLHSVNNPNLNCVQGNGMNLTFNDNTFDIIVVSETHIAEIDLDDESIIILNEIKRVLINNGYFVWGNALFTRTWNDIIYNHLPNIGYESCGINNVTSGAIEARYGDEGRAEAYWNAIKARILTLQWHSTCNRYIKQLLFNFYRNPGTNLFNTMVNGTDSYMQICNKITK
mmetsp:Transcript_14669/g.13172  ORF Transcript_14669/g.13172 Transcript_14669/m.13172 type:complete len:363 (+) Transcript_14669:135-1223(+)